MAAATIPYDFSNYTTGVTADLNPGAASITPAAAGLSGGGQYAHGNVYNAYLFNGDPRSYIENAIGGSGADKLIGNAIRQSPRRWRRSRHSYGRRRRRQVCVLFGDGSDTITDFTPVAHSTKVRPDGLLQLPPAQRRADATPRRREPTPSLPSGPAIA